MNESLVSREVIEKTERLLTSKEREANLNEHQIVLAEELYQRDNPGLALAVGDIGLQNRMMEYWITQGYSSAFRDLIERPEFKEHGRFNNDPLNVTLSDTEYFLHSKKLPEQ